MKLNYLKKITLLLFFITSYSNAQIPVIEWQKCLGGTGVDSATSIIQTTDGGYIVIGESNSNDGDVTGNHGDSDFLVVKLNFTGVIEWQKSLGGTGADSATSIIQTTDGGYIICGYSASNNGDVTGNHGNGDYWIIKLTTIGITVWQKSFGGTGHESPSSIIQTTDGGYIVSGISMSNNGDVTGNHGNMDYWIIKLTSLGILEWQKSLGGTGLEYAYNIIQTTDGGYIVTGQSNSNDGDVTGNHGNGDYWIVKLTSLGVIEWQKSLGGTGAESGLCITQTTDGGYIVSGQSNSNDGDVTGNHGDYDSWIIKLTSLGILEWQKSLGGIDYDFIRSVNQTSDGGFILAGNTSSNNGDVTGNHGNGDSWIVKLSPESLSTSSFLENKLSIYPNPTKDNLTIKLDYFTPNQEITITDILGKIINNQKLDGLTTTINTSNLEKGIYILNLINGTQLISQKFIKE